MARPVDTFELETAEGFRRLEFDPDLLGFKDVRVLLDGEPVATMPFPTTEVPRHEVELSVGKHELLAVTEARNGGALTIYDVFFEDRSLKNGSSLVASRAAARCRRGAGRLGIASTNRSSKSLLLSQVRAWAWP